MPRAHPPRLNRLPQRLDYTLIPAPLDLNGPIVDEKSPLPAIIVTPSSPCHETDFSIAFLAPPPKPSLRERIASRLPSIPSLYPRLPSQIRLPSSPFKDDFDTASTLSLKTKTRATLIFALLLFIMACHLVMHRMVTGHPQLEFGLGPDNDMVALNSVIPPSARYAAGMNALPSDAPAPASSFGDWFTSHNIWNHKPRHGSSGARSSARFIITDPGTTPPS